MKRTTRKWLQSWLDHLVLHHRDDILDSDARQRAEIRRLRKALHEFVDLRWPEETCSDREWAAIQTLKPRRNK